MSGLDACWILVWALSRATRIWGQPNLQGFPPTMVAAFRISIVFPCCAEVGAKGGGASGWGGPIATNHKMSGGHPCPPNWDSAVGADFVGSFRDGYDATGATLGAQHGEGGRFCRRRRRNVSGTTGRAPHDARKKEGANWRVQLDGSNMPGPTLRFQNGARNATGTPWRRHHGERNKTGATWRARRDGRSITGTTFHVKRRECDVTSATRRLQQYGRNAEGAT